MALDAAPTSDEVHFSADFSTTSIISSYLDISHFLLFYHTSRRFSCYFRASIVFAVMRANHINVMESKNSKVLGLVN